MIAKTLNQSYASINTENINNFKAIILMCGANIDGDHWRPLTTTVAPSNMILATCTREDRHMMAAYGGDPQNYCANLFVTSPTSLHLKSTSKYDIAVVYGIR